MSRSECFEASQEVPTSLETVFAFFSDPGNLQRLTPPWLGFRILTPAPLPVGEGARYDYRISLRSLPLRWRTLIERWEPGVCFVDSQEKGPYALWRHIHTFETLPSGGTRLGDRVEYRLPFGILGRLALPFVRREIQRIFDYRRSVISGLFDPPLSAVPPAGNEAPRR